MLVGMVVGFLVGLLGWQTNLISLHCGMARSRRATFFVGLGATTADLIWIFAAFAGAQSLLAAHHEYWNHVKWLGILTIGFAGLRILFHSSKSPADPKESRWNRTKDYLIGFLIVMGNPALLVMWVGIIGFILTYVMPEQLPAFFHILFMAGFAAGSAGWFLFLSLLILPRVRKWTDEKFHLLSKVFAAALLVGASVLIFKKF